jgi:dipeptidyl aminopeptidase/acylaminoacyl peptidase
MIRLFLVAIFSTACLNLVRAQSALPPTSLIVEQMPYIFPQYEKAPQLAKNISKEMYEAAISDTNFELQKLIYLSDGLKVTSYLYRPKQLNGERLPCIIYNRGGYVSGDQAYLFAPFFRRLAGEGFIILAPQLRESDSGEGKDEVGGADLADVMNMLPVAQSLSYIDTTNLFMYGESRGGMMTYQAIRNGFPLKAAAVFGAFTDFEALINEHPEIYLPLGKKIWPEFERQREEIVAKRSALQWCESINVPIFIMHGGADRSVNPSQSLNLAMKLQSLKKVYGLVVYPFDGHTLRTNQEDRDRRAIAWFKSHLKR